MSSDTPAGLHVAVHHGRRLVRDALLAFLGKQPFVRHVSSLDVPTRLLVDALVDVDVVLVDGAAEDAWQLLAVVAERDSVRSVLLHDGLSLGDAERAIRLGVRAVVAESAGLRAVVSVMRPDEWASQAIGPSRLGAAPVLDEVERDVLHSLSLGATSRSTATRLGISPTVVDEAKRRVFAKLGVGHQTHAVATALRLGLLDSALTPGDEPADGDRTAASSVAARRTESS